MIKPKLTREDLVNWWLQKYHNTTGEEVLVKHPDSKISPDWFKLYPVTQEQHDEWYEWAINYLVKEHRLSKKYIKSRFCFDYLNCAPNIIEPNT